MAGRQPEYSVRWPVVRQTWRTMTFIHWRYEPAQIQLLLPDGLEVDVRDGDAWVSLTPFELADFRPPIAPRHPRWPTFPETNLRTYAVGADGRDGIYFLDIGAASALTTLSLRALLDLPYHVARMEVVVGSTVSYRSRRETVTGAIGHDIEVRVGDAVDERSSGSLDQWLAGRWRAFGRALGRHVTVAVEHEPWALYEAQLISDEQQLLDAVGLAPPLAPPIVRYSPGVSVALGAPRLMTAR